MLDDDKGGKMMKEYNLFPRELKMYEKCIPEFETLYKDAGRDIQFAPKCLSIKCINETINLVFEDLKEKSFKNCNRLLGYDMSHMKRILQKLAEFHAASAVWEERSGPFPQEYHTELINDINDPEPHEKIFNARFNSYKKSYGHVGCRKCGKIY